VAAAGKYPTRKTASEVREQASKLAAQARALEEKARELDAAEARGVAGRIREAIAHCKFSVDDLFGDVPRKSVRSPRPKRAAKVAEVSSVAGTASSDPASPKSRKAARKSKAPVSGVKGKEAPIKYRDTGGNEWSGRGSQPRWLAEAIAGGKSLQDFSV
jgi:DNA-binding protein H-NS